MTRCLYLVSPALFILWCNPLVIPRAWGECHIERTDASAPVMVRRLIGPCTPDERIKLAIQSDDVLEAIMEGRGIELDGVVLNGDVMLDRLPVEPVLPQDLALPIIGERLSSGHIEEVRRIRAPIQLTRVDLQGIWATNFVMQGYLIMEGSLQIQETRIKQSIDFSRTAFLGEVNFSESTILYEGFFIQTVFAKGANFEMVNFGTHSRFHKAVFGGPTMFKAARFQGLAEFLEVAFLQEANFSGVQFLMGTGFSGSHFHEQTTFSGSGFDREVYFRFAEFDRDVTFQRVSFGAAADFTEAKFLADWEFSGATFAVGPLLPKPQAEALVSPENQWQGVRTQAGILGLLFIVLLLLIYRTRHSPRERPKNPS